MSANPLDLLITLERIEQLLRSELKPLLGAEGLQWVHLRMLDYLARANRYSNTPLAVAEYLNLTKGTVSQSLILLEEKGLVRRSDDAADRRIVRLTLTEAGEKVVAQTARRIMEFIGACAAHQTLEKSLLDFLRCLQMKAGGRSFGLCAECAHHLPVAPGAWRCGLTGEALTEADRSKICRDFRAPGVENVTSDASSAQQEASAVQ